MKNKAKRTYDEIKTTINSTLAAGHGVAGLENITMPVYFSPGIEALVEDYGETAMDYICNGLKQFLFEDLCLVDDYPSPLGNTPETGALMIDTIPDSEFIAYVLVHFDFETK